jgi:hypothetical protein
MTTAWWLLTLLAVMVSFYVGFTMAAVGAGP